MSVEEYPSPIFGEGDQPDSVNDSGWTRGSIEDFESFEYIEDPQEVKKRTKISHIGKRALQWGIVGAELGPWNEAMRYIPYGAAITATNGDPIVGAAVLGGSTLLVEGSAAIATASLITSESGVKLVNKTNEKLEKWFKIKPEAKASKGVKAGVAFVGGSVLNMALDQRENPERTTEDTRKYGLKVSGALAGVLAVGGAAGALGVEQLTDPRPIGVGIIALSGLYSAINYLKGKRSKG